MARNRPGGGGVAGGGQKQLALPQGVQGLSPPASQVAAPAPCTDSNLPARFLSHNCGHCLVSAFSVSLTTVSVASIFGKGANYSRHTVLAAIGTPSQSLIFIPRSPVARLAMKCKLVSLCLKRHRIKTVRDGERLCSRLK